MIQEKHPNSRKITIFRAPTFLHAAQNAEVQAYFAYAKRSIGSFWESPESQRIGSGLSPTEERILLPELIEVTAEDRDFMKKRNEYYQDISTDVPHDTGRTLEIGLFTSNKEPISLKNLPLNISDYLRYRHAVANPQVALSKEDAEGRSGIEFYIFDKAEVNKKNTSKADTKDAALQVYLKLKADPTGNKVKQALMLMGVNTAKLDPTDMEQSLRNLAEAKSDEFIRTCDTKEFDNNYYVKAMLEYKIIKRLGQKFFDVETDKLLASSEEEMVAFFSDDDNSDLVVTLKARLQEKER